MKKKFHFALVMLVAMSLSLHPLAQDLYSVDYAIAIPTNDLNGYVSRTSFRGITLGYFSHFTESFVEGLSIGWNGFYERKSYATYQDGTTSLSGIQYCHTDAVPVHFNGFYLFNPEGTLDPFAGLGIGIIYVNRTTDMELYRWREESWHFSLRPEGGILYNFRKQVSARLSIRYNAAFKTLQMGDQSFLSFNFGLVFKSLE